MKTITLTPPQLQELIKLAEDALPNECCAFLLCKHTDSRKVSMILPLRNVDESPVSFTVDPTELLNAYSLAESKGLEVTAIFHSHPAKASPSSTDMKYMQINPVIWLIYSTTEKDIKAFEYENEVMTETAIRIIDTMA